MLYSGIIKLPIDNTKYTDPFSPLTDPFSPLIHLAPPTLLK